MTASENPYAATVLSARVAFTRRPFVRPMQLSSGPIRDVTEAVAEVTVRVGKSVATGRGAIYLSDLWAWPHPTLSHAVRDEGMRQFAERIAVELPAWCPAAAHPLRLGMQLHRALHAWPDDAPPLLARLVCGSPFDAAIHDAVGRAVGKSAFALYDAPLDAPEVDAWFPDGGAAASIRRALRTPVAEHDAWLVVSYDDDAESLAPWVRGRGYRGFKLKILGKDSAADVERTRAVYRLVRELGAERPRLAADANCACPGAEPVREYLVRLQADDPAAFAALEYLEQPTGRDIVAHPNDWSAVTPLKPVLLDEGLVSMEALAEGRRQGWSGIAIKTCRGHSFALVTAAYAHEHGMRLALQDLTNPGLAAIHASLFAAHLPVCNGLELNSPQYTPDANAAWLPRLASLLAPTDGRHRLTATEPPGLGSAL